MSNEVSRTRALVAGLTAMVMLAAGCADLSDPTDPGVELLPDEPWPVEPLESFEHQDRLEPMPAGPTWALRGPATSAPAGTTSADQQVLRVQQGGELRVHRDEALAQSLQGDTTLELWFWLDADVDQPVARLGNVAIAIRDRKVWARLDGAEIQSAAIVSREWYHLALVAEGDQRRLYVNGQASGEVQAPSPWLLEDEAITFGGQAEDGGAFSGKLDNIRLTSQALYQADFPLAQQLVVLDNMAFAYDFDGQDGEKVEDRSGNERHGKLVGAAAMIDGAI